MPTVLRIDGLRVVIYPADPRPAHVDVIGRGCEAVFILQCPGGPPVCRESFGFGRAELSDIKEGLATHLGDLCDGWSEIHGQG